MAALALFISANDVFTPLWILDFYIRNETTRRVALEIYPVDRDEGYFNGPYEAMWAVASVTRKRSLCNGR